MLQPSHVSIGGFIPAARRSYVFVTYATQYTRAPLQVRSLRSTVYSLDVVAFFYWNPLKVSSQVRSLVIYQEDSTEFLTPTT
jgi:hypothetical protein